MKELSVKNSGKYIYVHLRFEEDMVAFSCCVYDGGKKEDEDMNTDRERGWKGKFTRPGRVIRPGAYRINGKCPLTPLEVGLMLRGMGFDKSTAIYLASGKIYDSERHMAPLLEMFPLLQMKEMLASEKLAPYKNFSSRMAAIDYTVCLHSEVFVTTQGGNFPQFLLGHRRYLYGGHANTVRPDKRNLGEASISGVIKPRSWFGPNGQYIRELPCPRCRGRGYTLCTECGIERSRKDCAQCDGKGMNTCEQCKGDRVIWEESIDERPWEKARSISPFKVKEDDVVDNLELNLENKRISKRVYQSSPPEVNLKISRSLKSLNARTGLFSNRMKIIHGDPMLHAQRVAAIKKAKGTADARKHASDTMKDFFRDPENRRKRSLSMKGIKFYCKNCGCEGHRKHYCPELKDNLIDRRFKCRLCGEKGHNRRTCPVSKSNEPGNKIIRNHHCRICGLSGHNRRTCQQNGLEKVITSPTKDISTIAKRTSTCRLCLKKGHNIRTCPSKIVLPLNQ